MELVLDLLVVRSTFGKRSSDWVRKLLQFDAPLDLFQPSDDLYHPNSFRRPDIRPIPQRSSVERVPIQTGFASALPCHYWMRLEYADSSPRSRGGPS